MPKRVEDDHSTFRAIVTKSQQQREKETVVAPAHARLIDRHKERIDKIVYTVAYWYIWLSASLLVVLAGILIWLCFLCCSGVRLIR